DSTPRRAKMPAAVQHIRNRRDRTSDERVERFRRAVALDRAVRRFDVAQAKLVDRLLHETDFLGVAVEQHEVQIGPRDGKRNPWQTGAGADIQDTPSL